MATMIVDIVQDLRIVLGRQLTVAHHLILVVVFHHLMAAALTVVAVVLMAVDSMVAEVAFKNS